MPERGPSAQKSGRWLGPPGRRHPAKARCALAGGQGLLFAAGDFLLQMEQLDKVAFRIQIQPVCHFDLAPSGAADFALFLHPGRPILPCFSRSS